MFKRASRLSLSWARTIQSKLPHHIHLRPILTLFPSPPSTPHPFKQPLYFTFPHQNSAGIFLLLHTCHVPCPSYHPPTDHSSMFGEERKL